jgi:hypothetical protein
VHEGIAERFHQIAHGVEDCSLCLGAVTLLLKYLAGIPLERGIEEHEATLDMALGLGIVEYRIHGHSAPLVKAEDIQVPIGGGKVVLLSDMSSEPLDFDVGGLAGKSVLCSNLSPKSVERLKQSDSKRTGGTQAGLRGDIGKGDDLDRVIDV